MFDVNILYLDLVCVYLVRDFQMSLCKVHCLAMIPEGCVCIS